MEGIRSLAGRQKERGKKMRKVNEKGRSRKRTQ